MSMPLFFFLTPLAKVEEWNGTEKKKGKIDEHRGCKKMESKNESGWRELLLKSNVECGTHARHAGLGLELSWYFMLLVFGG